MISPPRDTHRFERKTPWPITGSASAPNLEENWGEVALVDNHQYAIYKTKHGIYASDHLDPHSQALVLARGIIGEKNGHSTITSPLYKEVYDLTNGECLSDSSYSLNVYPVEVRDGDVYLLAN